MRQPFPVRASTELRPVQVLSDEAARVHVVALERHLPDGEGVVLLRRGEREASGRSAPQAKVVEHAHRVALRHHAALLREQWLHHLRVEDERRVEVLRHWRSVRHAPGEQRLVPGIVHGAEERSALVVAAALRRRERAAHDLGFFRRRGQVVHGGEVVPPDLFRRRPAREIEGVDGGAVTVAGRARLKDGMRGARERRVVRRRGVGVRVEARRPGG